MYILLPVDVIGSPSLWLLSLIIVIFGALESTPSRIMIESPFNFSASNDNLTVLPLGRLISQVQLKDPAREKS